MKPNLKESSGEAKSHAPKLKLNSALTKKFKSAVGGVIMTSRFHRRESRTHGHMFNPVLSEVDKKRIRSGS